MLLSRIWTTMVLLAVGLGAYNHRLDVVSKALIDGTVRAIHLSIELLGMTGLSLGLLEVLRVGGFLRTLAHWLRPVMHRLFPTVPSEHPAMTYMVLNMTANLLGLGNAATPFGLAAMRELARLHAQPHTTSLAMHLFLAINTSGLVLFPTGMIALRSSLHAQAPASFLLPTWLATISAALCGLCTAYLLEYWQPQSPAALLKTVGTHEAIEHEINQDHLFVPALPSPSWMVRWWAHAASALLLLGLAKSLQFEVAKSGLGMWAGLGLALSTAAAGWLLPLLLALVLLFGLYRDLDIYAAVVRGGKDGFAVILKITPYLLAMMVATSMLQAAGVIANLTRWVAPLTHFIGMPAEALPMALLRPLSGQGAYALAAELMSQHGPDSLIGNIVATLMGSTETTFYVLSVYLGVIGIHNSNRALLVCLMADVAGVLVGVWSNRWLLGAG